MAIQQKEPIIDTWEFRRTMGLFATGVTVVACEVDGIVRGMTANAVTSVSLEPPLLLVCVQKNAHMSDFLRLASGFSVNILNEDQADLSQYFANLWPGPEPPPFRFQAWTGSPRLEGAIGALACQTYEFLEGGDHWIVLGRVVDMYRSDSPARPLLYFTGRYAQLDRDGRG